MIFLQIGEAFIEIHTESLTTIEENKLKNQRKNSGQPQGNLTIPDLSRSQKAKEKLIDDKKPRHGFNDLTNITGIAVEKVSKMLKRNRKEKKEEENS